MKLFHCRSFTAVVALRPSVCSHLYCYFPADLSTQPCLTLSSNLSMAIFYCSLLLPYYHRSFFRSHFVAVIRFDLKPSIFSTVAIFIFALVTACSKPFSAIFSLGLVFIFCQKGFNAFLRNASNALRKLKWVSC